MSKVTELPLYFKNMWSLDEYPVLIISVKTLLELWARGSGYIPNIHADVRYKNLEEANAQFENLVTSGEPLEIPQVGIVDPTVPPSQLALSYSNGRHLTRYLIDSCNIIQMPLQLYAEDAKFLAEAKLARYAALPEIESFQNNSNGMALRIFHMALMELKENELEPNKDNLNIQYAAHYKERPFFEHVIPLAKMQNYFVPLQVAREKSWLAGAVKDDFGIS